MSMKPGVVYSDPKATLTPELALPSGLAELFDHRDKRSGRVARRPRGIGHTAERA